MAYVPVWVQPGAKRDRIVGEHGGHLKVAVTAPPEGGRANKAVAALLAKELGTKKSSVEIVSGAASRKKRVAILDVSVHRVKEFCKQFGNVKE
ncbi:MAG: DUF167 domain-containing protein [Planctomycetes bacterium]|nr:DUF167 domain-containing protein [Planctomycetota bacterium]